MMKKKEPKYKVLKNRFSTWEDTSIPEFEKLDLSKIAGIEETVLMTEEDFKKLKKYSFIREGMK